jgi:4-diphosphocytidyl-2-C-methyl-D-erythritol kinase
VRLRVRAPAKLNLTLEVVGRRADGFHEIRSVVQTIDLCDTLEAEPAPGLALSAPDGLGPIAENLALRAAVYLREVTGMSGAAHLFLSKRVPVGAGLGGGSSDAAAALRLLARLWRLRRFSASMVGLAASLGSDVPYFLAGGTALLSGRGEQVERLPPLRSGHFVLVVPRWSEPRKTARVYAALTGLDYGGRATTELACAQRAGRPITRALFTNGLEPAAQRIFPGLADFHQRLEAATGAAFTLSGSGPTLFHLSTSRAEAAEIADLAQALGAAVYPARPLTALPRVRRVD